MIKIFGEEAKKIEPGQIFKARLDSVDGRDIVVLEPVIKYDNDNCPYYEVRLE